MALGSTHRQRHRKGLASSASTTDALLVVEPLRWHVGLQHCLEGSDIDANFHCGGHREEINLFRLRPEFGGFVIDDLALLITEDISVTIAARPPPRKENVPKIPLPLRPVVRLAGEFLAMEPEGTPTSNELSADEVVLRDITTRSGWVDRQFRTTARAPPISAM
jgi:hypothetical protein